MSGRRPDYPTLGEATRVWLRIALLSFGGPAGQIAVMHRILVEERRWLGDGRFLHALNFCMLLPGPEAQQLATYVGWLMHGARGGLVAGILFVVPGVGAIMALSWLYVLFGEVGIVSAAFFGLKTAVLAIVLQALVRIGSRSLRNRTLLAVAASAFVAIFFGVPFPIIILAAGVIGYLTARAGSRAFAPGGGHGARGGVHVSDAETLLGEESLGVLPAARRAALHAGLIALVLWLLPVGLLVLVAGPLIMVLQFVGFLAAFREAGWASPLLAGTIGGLLATWVTFAPCFAWIFLGAPHIERLRGNPTLTAALTAVSAAVVGVILNLAIWFAIHVLFREVVRIDVGPLAFDLPRLATLDVWAAVLSVLALFAVFRLRLGIVTVIGGAAALGALLRAFGVA